MAFDCTKSVIMQDDWIVADPLYAFDQANAYESITERFLYVPKFEICPYLFNVLNVFFFPGRVF